MNAKNVGCGCLCWIVIIIGGIIWIGSCQSNGKTAPPEKSEQSIARAAKKEFKTDKPKLLDVSIDLQTSIIAHNRVRLIGFSNLPGGAKLIFSILSSTGEVLAQDKGVTDDYGRFSSIIFFEKYGLENGKYLGEVLMPTASTQTPEIQAIIGQKGEMLVGKFVSVEKYGGGNIISATVPFTINLEASIKKEKEFHENRKKMISEIRLSSCALLDELLNFKDSDDFAFYGFGVGGPYNSWLQRVKILRDDVEKIPLPQRLSPAFRAAPGYILMFGMEFLHSKGMPTRLTEEHLPQVMDAINFSEYLKQKK